MICPACKGEPWYECRECHGAGDECVACSGQGQVPCRVCKGTGELSRELWAAIVVELDASEIEAAAIRLQRRAK